MADSIPYLAAPGSVKTALDKIRQAATPERVTGDFMNTRIGIKGGTGRALIPFLKKIGFVNPDGTPTELYKQFRNPSVGGQAMAQAIKLGYKALAEVNEYFYDLNDSELKSLLLQVTGGTADSAPVKLGVLTLKNLKAFANFTDAGPTVTVESSPQSVVPGNRESIELLSLARPKSNGVGLNLSYTINLNLPATADQAVFNAIFRSLKEHLLSNAE